MLLTKKIRFCDNNMNYMDVICVKNAVSNCCNRWQVNKGKHTRPKSPNVKGLQFIMGRNFVENIMTIRQEVPQLLWPTNVHYHVRKIEPPDRIHSDSN
jgi:hypothetical protein